MATQHSTAEAKPKAKPKGKPKAKKRTPRPKLTAEQVREIAKLRRGGGTWKDVYQFLGYRSTSTQLRGKMEAAGYDRFGRKGGKGKSKARGHGAKGDPNITPAPIKRAAKK